MQKIRYIIGIDEVGRGPLAGPLAVAAVLLQIKGGKSKVKRLLKGIKDSKQLSSKQREEWFIQLKEYRNQGVLNYTFAFVAPQVLDGVGMTEGTRRVIARAMARLACPPESTLVLLDGGLKAPKEFENQKTIIRGDKKEPIIAAASIIAKVLRDRRMCRYAKIFPQYGFEQHKGYGTAFHIACIREHGLCELHRRSFTRRIA